MPEAARGAERRRLEAEIAELKAHAGEPGASAEGPAAAAPADATLRSLPADPAAAARGKAAFASCAGCHGAEAEGRVGIAPRLNSATFLAAASDRFLVDTITHGRAGTTMIGWGQSLGAPAIQDIVVYLRSLSPVPPATLDESPLAGDAEKGAATFGSICATCHGRHGGGYQETGNGTGIGRRAFLASATNGFLRHLVRHGKSDTPMRPFTGARTSVANLDPAEIDNVIAYMRASAW
ncbi:MAG: c-type cytochrome [bacterium]